MKTRSAITLQMILTRKGGAHRDRRAESRRKARQTNREFERDQSY